MPAIVPQFIPASIELARNVPRSEMDHRSDVRAIAIADTRLIAGNQLYDLLAFANEQAKCSDVEFLYNVGVREKHSQIWKQ